MRLKKFYKVHESKPFYNDLCAYLSSGPIVVMKLQKIMRARKQKVNGSYEPKGCRRGDS